MKSIKVRIVYKRSVTIATIRNRHEVNQVIVATIVQMIVQIIADQYHATGMDREIGPDHHVVIIVNGKFSFFTKTKIH